MSGIGLSYLVIFILSCIEYIFHYKLVNFLNKKLTEKQKSNIMTIKSSLTLLLVGIYYNYYYFASNFNQEKFYDILESKGSLNFGILFVLYFTAYLVVDIYIGNSEYPKYMKSLSGNFHHFIYTIINLVSLYTGIFPVYLLYMISEAPTLLLGIGSFDSKFRNDNLFGLIFFLTRILYHIVLIITFRQNKLVLSVGLLALIMHIYWFYGWFKKYGIKYFQSKFKKCVAMPKQTTKQPQLLKKVRTSLKKLQNKP